MKKKNPGIYDLKNELKDILFRSVSESDDLTPLHAIMSNDDLDRVSHLIRTIRDKEAEIADSMDRETKAEKMCERIYAHDLYPFRMLRCKSLFIVVKHMDDGSCLFGDTFARKKDGYYFSDSYEETKNESFADVVEKCRFLTREEFEKKVMGPLLGIPGEIFSTIPKEERFRVVAHYDKPWRREIYDGYFSSEGDETKMAHVDLLTGGGTYFGGILYRDIKEDVCNVLSAKTLKAEMLAMGEFSFFYKDAGETFVLMDGIPEGLENTNRGKLIDDTEERNLSHWRGKLLEKYGFNGVDFSKADVQSTTQPLKTAAFPRRDY